MIKKGQNSLNDACDLIINGNEGSIPKILEREDIIDRLQREITEYLVELSRRDLEPAEAKLIPALIHVVNDAERLGDHAEAFIELYNLLRQGELSFTNSALSELKELQQVLNTQFSALYETLEKHDLEGAKKAIHTGRRIKEIIKQFTENHVHRLDTGECSVKAGVIFLDALAHLERVSDHVVNIAERAEIILTVVKP
jgi:phosphate:Na+ symporter